MTRSKETGFMSYLVHMNTNASTTVESYCERKQQDAEENLENFVYCNFDSFHLVHILCTYDIFSILILLLLLLLQFNSFHLLNLLLEFT